MEFVVYNEGIIINCSALIMLPFIVYPSKCHVIITICDVGGAGLYWHGTRTAAPAAASRFLT